MKNKISKRTTLVSVAIVAILIALGSVVIFAQSTQNASKVLDSYMVCGCGICGGTESNPDLKYYSKSKGEEEAYNSAVQNDKEIAQSNICKVAGCSIGPCTKLILTE